MERRSEGVKAGEKRRRRKAAGRAPYLSSQPHALTLWIFPTIKKEKKKKARESHTQIHTRHAVNYCINFVNNKERSR